MKRSQRKRSPESLLVEVADQRSARRRRRRRLHQARPAFSITISPERADRRHLAGADERRRERLADDRRAVDAAPRRQRLAVVLGRLERLVGEVAELEHPRRRRRRPTVAVESGVLDLVRRHDELDAVGDALHRQHREPVAEAPLVLRVEALHQLGDRVLVDRAVRHLDERRLPALAEEPAVEAAADLDVVPAGADAFAQPLLHLREHGRDLRRRFRARA